MKRWDQSVGLPSIALSSPSTPTPSTTVTATTSKPAEWPLPVQSSPRARGGNAVEELAAFIRGMNGEETLALVRQAWRGARHNPKAVAVNTTIGRRMTAHLDKRDTKDQLVRRLCYGVLGDDETDAKPSDVVMATDITTGDADLAPVAKRVGEHVIHLLDTQFEGVRALADSWRDDEKSTTDVEIRETLWTAIEAARIEREKAAGAPANPFADSPKPTTAVNGESLAVLRAWGAYWIGSSLEDDTVPVEKWVEARIQEWVDVAMTERTARARLRKSDAEYAKIMRTGATFVVAFAPEWAYSGFPIIEPTHKLAASLMATWMPPECAPELRCPWSTFVIRLPAELVPNAFLVESEPITYVGLTQSDEGWLLFLGARDHVMMAEAELESLAELVGKPTNKLLARLAVAAPPAAVELIFRFIVGVLVEMDTPTNRATRLQRPSVGKTKRSGPPASWSFVLRRDVKIDARQWVKAYALGEGEKGARGALGVQILVRGHHKRQVCGAGRQLRKWIHIEPYWRGPEDAPIATRAHTLDVRATEPKGST